MPLVVPVPLLLFPVDSLDPGCSALFWPCLPCLPDPLPRPRPLPLPLCGGAGEAGGFSSSSAPWICTITGNPVEFLEATTL